jgi:hypothetical protein
MKQRKEHSKVIPRVGFPGKNIIDKRINQIIGIFGDGKFADGNETSEELRYFLAQVQKEHLKAYANQCVNEKFDGNGFALQDIVNELGKRLGFDVEYGRYRGVPGKPGHDGLWLAKNGGHSFVVESKVTDSFPIKGNELSEYREKLIEEKKIGKQNSSILLVYGRGDRERLVSQLIGSAVFANIQVVSVVGLFDLLDLKENIEKNGVRTVHDLLKPVLTVEKSIDFVRSCMGQDIKRDGKKKDVSAKVEIKNRVTSKSISAPDYEHCRAIVARKLNVDLRGRNRVLYDSGDKNVGVILMVSKTYERSKGRKSYWYAVHPKRLEDLSGYRHGYLAFGCGSKGDVVLFPFSDFQKVKEILNTTENENRMYWHVQIHMTDEGLVLGPKKGHEEVPLVRYLVSRKAT